MTFWNYPFVIGNRIKDLWVFLLIVRDLQHGGHIATSVVQNRMNGTQ